MKCMFHVEPAHCNINRAAETARIFHSHLFVTVFESDQNSAPVSMQNCCLICWNLVSLWEHSPPPNSWPGVLPLCPTLGAAPQDIIGRPIASAIPERTQNLNHQPTSKSWLREWCYSLHCYTYNLIPVITLDRLFVYCDNSKQTFLSLGSRVVTKSAISLPPWRSVLNFLIHFSSDSCISDFSTSHLLKRIRIPSIPHSFSTLLCIIIIKVGSRLRPHSAKL